MCLTGQQVFASDMRFKVNMNGLTIVKARVYGVEFSNTVDVGPQRTPTEPRFQIRLNVLKSHLVSGGHVVSFDPLESARTIRFLRWIYRPFQQDADWEWPFQKSTFSTIEKHFVIEEIQGYLGKAKWPIFLTPIPGAYGLALKMGVKTANFDQINANRVGRDLWPCMQVAMKLVKPE